jgi:hypothetical protein
MDRRLLPPETFFEGTPPHVRAYIEQLHATIAELHTRIIPIGTVMMAGAIIGLGRIRPRRTSRCGRRA